MTRFVRRRENHDKIASVSEPWSRADLRHLEIKITSTEAWGIGEPQGNIVKYNTSVMNKRD